MQKHTRYIGHYYIIPLGTPVHKVGPTRDSWLLTWPYKEGTRGLYHIPRLHASLAYIQGENGKKLLINLLIVSNKMIRFTWIFIQKL